MLPIKSRFSFCIKIIIYPIDTFRKAGYTNDEPGEGDAYERLFDV